jgi:SAM-dependent methyltransferase
MDAERAHWDKVYDDKAETAVSWYQPHSATSLKWIETASPNRDASVIDVGGGASTLVDDLLASGFADVTVLDISRLALKRSKGRLGKASADKVGWMVVDVTRWVPPRTWDIWHDRAAFHFMTDAASQAAYIAALTAATRPGATVILSTFGEDAPAKCSGLAIERYSPGALGRALGPDFEPVAAETEIHRTPGGAERPFSYAVLKHR